MLLSLKCAGNISTLTHLLTSVVHLVIVSRIPFIGHTMSCVHVNSGDHAAQVPGPFEASCVRERATAVFIILVVARQSKQRLTDAVDDCIPSSRITDSIRDDNDDARPI